MNGAKDLQEAIASLGARVERLEELYALYQKGEFSGEKLTSWIDAARKATEQDRDLFNAFYSDQLGPFNYVQYGKLQRELENKIASYLALKELWRAETITTEFLADALACLNVFWLTLKPWREIVRQEVESRSEWIEEDRKRALQRAGLRDPLAPRVKRKSTPEEMQARAYSLLAKSLQESASDGKKKP